MTAEPYGVARRAGGRIRVRLPDADRRALAEMVEGFGPLLTGSADPAIRDRLYPPAYDDPELDAEYRDLSADGLVASRQEGLTRMTATLAGGAVTEGTWSTELDTDEADAWMRILHDIRLALAARLGITSPGQWEDAAGADPAMALLSELAWLEQGFVEALLGGLDD